MRKERKAVMMYTKGWSISVKEEMIASMRRMVFGRAPYFQSLRTKAMQMKR